MHSSADKFLFFTVFTNVIHIMLIIVSDNRKGQGNTEIIQINKE